VKKSNHTANTITILLFMITIIMSGNALQPEEVSHAQISSAFPIIGWDLGRHRPGEFLYWIDEAEKNGVNVITLSHDISHRWFQILDDEKHASEVEQLAALARSRGMDVYLWLRDFERPPEEFISDEGRISYLDFDNPDLWIWLDGIYQAIMDAVPSMSGVVLFMTEADWMVHRGEHEMNWIKTRRMRSVLEPQERMAKLMNAVYASLASRDKHMIVRDFFRSPLEMELFLEALESVPDDVWIYSKHVPDDFRYNYPVNPNIGRYGDRVNVVEMEPGWPGGVYYYRDQIKIMRDRGVQGIIPRIRFDISTPRDFNNYVFNVLMHNPDADVDALWYDFFTERYGNADAVAVVKNILPQAFTLRFVNNYHLAYHMDRKTGFYLMQNDKLREPNLTDRRLLLGQTGSVWFRDPELQRYPELSIYRDRWLAYEQRILDGDPELIDLLVTEKKWCEEYADSIISELIQSRSYFTPGDFSELYELISGYRLVSQSMQAWAPAYISLAHWRTDKLDQSRLIKAHNALEKVKEMVDSHRYASGLDVFYDGMKNELPPRPEPIELPSPVLLYKPDDDQILTTDEIRLIWRQSIPEVTTYHIEISADADFDTIVFDTLVSRTSIIVDNIGDAPRYWWRARARNREGWGDFGEAWCFFKTVTGIEVLPDLPRDFKLFQNHPNPFNHYTNITYEIPIESDVHISVYNTIGQQITILVDRRQDAGSYNIHFDASGIPSGVYFYRLRAGAFSSILKMVYIQ
jgi:hypothetical protein